MDITSIEVKAAKNELHNMSLYKNTNRYTYIDAIRISAMCLVVTLHCICGYYNSMWNSEKLSWWILGVVNEICRTGVPLFFMISGFLLLSSDKTADIKSFYKKRFLKLCIPFLIYNFLYYCYYRTLNDQSIISTDIFKELLESGSAYHLWFIYTILILYLFTPFVKIIVDKCNTKLLILFFALSIFQPTIKPFINTLLNGHIHIYLSDDGIVGYMGYMIMGYILGTYNIKIRTFSIIAACVMSISVFAAVNSVVAYHTWDFILNGGYTLNHYIEAAFIFLLFKNFKHYNHGRLLHRLSGLSMSVYFIHVFIMEAAGRIFSVLPRVQYYILVYTLTLILSFVYAYVLDLIRRNFTR